MKKTLSFAIIGLAILLVGCTPKAPIQDQITDQDVNQLVTENDNAGTDNPTSTTCYEKYSGNLTPLLVASFEYPCTWTVPITGGKVSSPDGTAVLEYPAPDVGLPFETISSGNVLINGENYTKTIYKNGNIFVEYMDLGTIEQYDLDIIFHYQNEADRDELYRILDTFKF